MLVHKYLEDDYWNNNYYAQIGGVSLSEMNFLEISMLELLEFKLTVSISLFQTIFEKMKLAINPSN